LGIIHRLLARVLPINHSLDGGGAGVGGPGSEIAVAFPVAEVKRFAGVVVVGQQIMDEVVGFAIIIVGFGGGIAVLERGIGVGEGVNPGDVTAKRHAEDMAAGRLVAGEGQKVGDVGGESDVVLARIILGNVHLDRVAAHVMDGVGGFDEQGIGGKLV